jgi:hypothetical protein
MAVISAEYMNNVGVMYVCVVSLACITDVEGRYLCCIVTEIVFVVV